MFLSQRYEKIRNGRHSEKRTMDLVLAARQYVCTIAIAYDRLTAPGVQLGEWLPAGVGASGRPHKRNVKRPARRHPTERSRPSLPPKRYAIDRSPPDSREVRCGSGNSAAHNMGARGTPAQLPFPSNCAARSNQPRYEKARRGKQPQYEGRSSDAAQDLRHDGIPVLCHLRNCCLNRLVASVPGSFP
jgi:hypothetical protein